MRVPFSRVYEVTTFYSRFTSVKKGRHEVSVCLGTACYVMGSKDILEKVKDTLHVCENQTTEDGRFTVTSRRCVGACALAPVVIAGKDVHSKMVPEKVVSLLDAYQ